MPGSVGRRLEPGTLREPDDQTEFEFGLDVLLDGLERRRTGATGRK